MRLFEPGYGMLFAFFFYIVLSWCIYPYPPNHTMTAVPPCCRAVKGKPDPAKAKAKPKAAKAKKVKTEENGETEEAPEEEEAVPEPSRKKAKRKQ